MNIPAMKRNVNIAIRPAMALAVLIAPQKSIGMVAALINVVGVARLQWEAGALTAPQESTKNKLIITAYGGS
ncbi:MAG: hypothetical protein LCH72_13050 [Proteobacteria bacterium]|nr:hypothetical protein [Pseudomonadota bacterium]